MPNERAVKIVATADAMKQTLNDLQSARTRHLELLNKIDPWHNTVIGHDADIAEIESRLEQIEGRLDHIEGVLRLICVWSDYIEENKASISHFEHELGLLIETKGKRLDKEQFPGIDV